MEDPLPVIVEPTPSFIWKSHVDPFNYRLGIGFLRTNTSWTAEWEQLFTQVCPPYLGSIHKKASAQQVKNFLAGVEFFLKNLRRVQNFFMFDEKTYEIYRQDALHALMCVAIQTSSWFEVWEEPIQLYSKDNVPTAVSSSTKSLFM